MVVTQRNPPTNSRKNKSQPRIPAIKNKNSQVKPKDTFDCKTDDVTPGEFVNGKYVETSPISSPVRNYQQQNQQTNKQKTNPSPVRPSLHTNSSPLVNNMVPFTNLYYNTPPVHYRNYSTPTMYPITAPPAIPTPNSLAKPIPFPNLVEEPKTLLAPSKLGNKSSPSIPIPLGTAFSPNPQKATRPGYFSVDELEQNNSSPKKSETYELGSPGSSPPISSSAPKRLQNAVVKPANTRYYSDGNYANAPHPSDLPRPQFS